MANVAASVLMYEVEKNNWKRQMKSKFLLLEGKNKENIQMENIKIS